MTLSSACRGRLYNWKFGQAKERLRDARASDEEEILVKALARAFGDVGYFDGDLAEIVRAAVSTLVTDDDFDAE